MGEKRRLRERVAELRTEVEILEARLKHIEESNNYKLFKKTRNQLKEAHRISGECIEVLARQTELANRYQGELEQWTNRCIQAEGRRDELEVRVAAAEGELIKTKGDEVLHNLRKAEERSKRT